MGKWNGRTLDEAQKTSSLTATSPILKRLPGLHYLPALITAVAVVLLAAFAVHQQKQLGLADDRNDVTQKLSVVRSRLEANISINLAVAQGLSEAIGMEPDIGKDKLEELTRRIISHGPQIRSTAIAPDLKVTMVYPLKGNERVIGLDFNTNLAQKDAALLVKKTRRPVVAGPIKLVQGGEGLLARFPVLNGKDPASQTFWGLISAVIDLDKLYAESGVIDDKSGIKIAIVRRQPGQPEGSPFFGDPAILSSDPVHMTVNFGFENWEIFGIPKQGWDETSAPNWSFQLLFVFFGLLTLVPMIWIGKLMADRQAHFKAIQKREDQLTKLSRRLELALNTSKIGIWEYNVIEGTLNWDKRMRDLYFVQSDKVMYRFGDWKRMVHPDDVDKAMRDLNYAIETDTECRTDFRIYSPQGQIRHIRAIGNAFTNAEGQKVFLGVNWDVTADTLMQEQLLAAKQKTDEQNRALEQSRNGMEYAALHDALTGLPNRRYLDKILQERNGEEPLAILHVDLDRFKDINDTFGHAAGDLILKNAASALIASVCEGDFIARIGGDEFVIVSSLGGDNSHYSQLAAQLVTAISSPVLIDDHECRVGASIGIATNFDNSDDPERLLIDADIALYEAKRKGRNRVELFTDSLREVAINTKRTSDEILRAIDQDEFVTYFQPQFDAKTLEICGAEALVRWQHPEKGILTPDNFLQIAENLKVVSAIDAAVLSQTHLQMLRMMADGIDMPRLSVNISAQRLKDQALFDHLDAISFPQGKLSVELLESISFEGDDGALSAPIERLRAMGIDIEVDDFGTGHASILTLVKLQPKRLKIDRQLVFPIVGSKTQRALVHSIIELGQSRGIEIVAEGVETFEHAAILRELGCDILQGYALAKPMPAHELAEFVISRRWIQAARKEHLLA